MILILTDRFDKHADIVCSKLKKLACDYFRLDLDVESLKSSHITFSNKNWLIVQNNINVESNEIEKVWARRAFVETTLEETNLNEPGFKIWRGEWNKTLLGLYNSLRSIDWLNPLSKAYQAENKYLQMEHAVEIGFELPPMIVSNKKSELIKFVSTHSEVVLKMMNQEFYKDDDGVMKGIYVNKVKINDFNDFEESSENPIVLQTYINKDYEVRYTVVAGEHHVCKIESQKSELACIDWRRYDIPNTPHYPILPPNDIKEKVVKFLDSLDLKFGAMDFIVTKEGQWYFLEINTMGQWLWIEDLTDLKISDSIVNYLIKKKDSV